MRSFSPDTLAALARRTIEAMGAAPTDAEQVADHLVAANLAGHDSHGVGMLPDYARMFGLGLLRPDAVLTVLHDGGPVLHLDAGRGFGQVMAREAMRLGIERAKALGAAVVGLRNSAHVGRVGAYSEQCADAGIVSVHFCNVADHDPHQAPHGCRDPRLGTNPFSAGVPMPDGRPLTLDMATSAIAFGKARVARNKGVPVPAESIIDADGRPTTDPTALVDRHEGALKSFGQHKGSGLAIMCDLLGGALTGGKALNPGHAREGGIVNSLLSILVDPAAFGDPAAIGREMAATGAWIKASRPTPDVEAVLLPGEPERQSRARRAAAGIPVDDKSLDDILAAAASLGVPRSELDGLVGG